MMLFIYSPSPGCRSRCVCANIERQVLCAARRTGLSYLNLYFDVTHCNSTALGCGLRATVSNVKSSLPFSDLCLFWVLVFAFVLAFTIILN